MQRIGPFVLVALAAGSFPWPARAQTSARLTGVVQSSAGQNLAGAKVKAIGQNRSDVVEVTAGADGSFVLPQLDADTYQVSASADGYNDGAVVVELGVGQARAIELKLNTLAESTVIAVATDAATADLSSARLSVNVTPQEVSGLPLNGRGYSLLTLFAPGAVNRSDGGFDKLSFSGQPNGSNRYNFDGIDASSVIDPNPGWFPVVGTQFRLQTSIESMQEFRIDSALQPAEFGMGAGGQVNLISKSGGSDLHAALYEYLRHSDLAARDFFAVGSDSRLRMNQFGGAAGGPIPHLLGKDRAFFFVAFENLGESSRVDGEGTVPTATLMAITNPATRAFLAVLPVATLPDPRLLLSLADRSGMSRLNEWNGSGRLDFTLNEKNKLALRYVKARQSLNTLDQTTVTPRFMQAHAAPDNAMASWDAVLGSAFEEVKFGVNRAPTGLAYTTPYAWMNDLGLLPGAQLSSWMFGGVGLQAGGDYGRTSDYRSRSYSVIESVAWTKGTHNLKAGFEWREARVPLSMLGGTLYSFSTEGFLADLGATVSYTADFHGEAAQTLFGAYLQDEWRLRPDLTLNIGLRYEYYTPVNSVDGEARVFDAGTLSYLPAGSGFYRAEKLGLAPRVGIAWAPAAFRSRTIFRWGGAVHYSPGPLRDLLGPIENEATRVSADNQSYPTDMLAVDAAGHALDNPIGIDPSAKFPERVSQWGFSVQQVLPAQFTLQAAYLGSAGRNLLTNRWANLVTGMTPYATVIRQDPAYGEIGYVAAGGNANYNALQLQFNRRFTADFVVGAQYSWSHNITDAPSDAEVVQDPNCLRCEKGPADFDVRQSAALDANYHIPLGRGARHLTKGPAGMVLAGWSTGAVFNVRSGLPVNVVLQRSDVAWIDAGGQMVSLGTPGAVPVLDTPYGGGTRGTLRPDVVGGVSPYTGNRLLVFNPAALTVPQRGAYGDMGRDALLGPGFAQLDFQATRSFRISERSGLEFRADCYNLMNHANFAQPSAMLVNVSPFVQPGEPFGAAQSANFGVISSTIGRNLGLGTARQIQLGLRLTF